LCLQFVQNHFTEEYDPVIEDSYRKQIQYRGRPVVIDVLITAGQEEYSAMREQWIRGGQGFYLGYGIDSKYSFGMDKGNVPDGNLIQSFLNQISRVKDVDIKCVPLVIVGNKIDLEDSRQVTFQEGKALAERNGAAFFETSAKNRVNVDESFVALVDEIEKRRQKLHGINRKD